MPPMKNVLEVLTSTTAYFKDKGVESPRLNMEHLLAHILGKKSRMDLYMEFDRPLGDKELDTLRELVKKRAQGVPLQHLLGTSEFHGRTFVTDSRALVPRPETEHFVELLLKLELPADARCLDVGTGSGVIALTLAGERPEVRVQAVDRSPNALSLARENAEKLGLAGRVEFLQGDLFEGCAGPYHLVAANLPYIPVGDIAGLAREVQHDPMMALDGGADGLEIVARCVKEAPGKLAPGGHLGLEIGHDQAARVQEMLAAAGYQDIRVVQDFQEFDRFVFGTKGG